MASNGRLSISARSSPAPASSNLPRIGSRIKWFCVIAAFACTALLIALPLTLLLPLAAAGLCLALMPRAPLAMLVVLLTLSPLRTLIATESGIQLPLDIGQILLALYLGFWVAYRVIKRRTRLTIRPEPVLLSAIAFCAVLAIGVWTAGNIVNWLSEWLKWVAVALMIWHGLEAGRANWRWLVFAVVVSAVANGIVGLYIFFGGSGAQHLLILGRYFRAFGTFGQPNPFGGVMGIALPLAAISAAVNLYHLLLELRAGGRIDRSRALLLIACVCASAILAAALVASWSRGAWLGLALALCAMLVALPRRLLHGMFLALALAAFFAALWSADLLPRSVVNRLTTAASDLFTISDVRGFDFTPANYAVVERLAHWQAAVSMAREQPIFGVGLGNYAAVYDEYRLINWEAPLGHAHNLYLNFLAETGALGLSAYLAFWLAIFLVTWRTRRHPDRTSRSVAIGLLGCWTYIAVHSVFDNLFVNNLFLHTGVLLGVLAILQHQVNGSLEVE